MIKNIKIKYRIALGYAVPVALSLAVLIIVYVNVQEVVRKSAALEVSHSIVDGLQDFDIGIGKIGRGLSGYYLAKNPPLRKLVEDGMAEARRFSGMLAVLITDPLLQEKFRALRELGNQVMDHATHELNFIDQGKDADALALFRTGERSKLIDGFEKAIHDIRVKEMEIMGRRVIERDDAINVVVKSVVAGALASFLLAGVMGAQIVARISREIIDAIGTLTSTTTEIAATVTEHERTATQQSAMVGETTVTVEELNASAHQSSEQAAAAAANAQNASALTEQGINTVKQATDGINALKAKVEAVAGQIFHLGEQTGQIGNIATVVRDLASQTNMLALNAAVEAARAGEHGKGFAVVASEVRKLADQSKKSAEHASLLIAEIQKSVAATIMTTEEGSKAVNEVTTFARQIGEFFKTLYDTAGVVYKNAQQVMLNAKQQSAALLQVVAAINGINSGVKETAAGLGQTKVSVQQLAETAQNLKTMV